MKVYHGTNIKIEEPKIINRFKTVNCYEFNEKLSNFAVLKFDFADEKWLDFVVDRRKGVELTEKYDLIIGPVANDDVFGTIILYEAGQLDKESAVKRFKIKELYNQVVFCNEEILKNLKFEKSYKVEVER